MIQLEIKSLNISEKRGTVKLPVDNIEILKNGIRGDAHAGFGQRQVSLLGTESLQKAAQQNNREFQYGDFGENITTKGFELQKVNILDQFRANNVILEVTQIGKKCHSGCEIMQNAGSCIMPIEGIFCRVIQGGTMHKGDTLNYIPKAIKIAVITMSDRAYNGIYEDKSGPHASKMLKEYFAGNNRPVSTENLILPDNKSMLENAISKAVKNKTDIIVTTGGTGIGSKDITPDVIHKMLDKEIPGIMELIRYKYGSTKPNALLSRSVAGIIDKSLIYTLPGSVKAVNEYLSEINKTLEHSLRMINDIDLH